MLTEIHIHRSWVNEAVVLVLDFFFFWIGLAISDVYWSTHVDEETDICVTDTCFNSGSLGLGSLGHTVIDYKDKLYVIHTIWKITFNSLHYLSHLMNQWFTNSSKMSSFLAQSALFPFGRTGSEVWEGTTTITANIRGTMLWKSIPD